MQDYLDLMQDILQKGEIRGDRTGIGTLSLFGTSYRFDLRDGFPAMTTKRLAFKQVCAELCCFLRAYDNLEDFHSVGCTIWDANAAAPNWRANHNCTMEGDLGRTYGVQWRQWYSDGTVIDQLSAAVKLLHQDPGTRRAVVTAWNPGELEHSCLPPCHTMFQFSARKGNSLDCFVTMRSVDVLLGMPFDIASYALLTSIVAQSIGLSAGQLFMAFGDTHIYLNHLSAAEEQLAREPYGLPRLVLDAAATIDCFHPGMAELADYESHPAITAKMNI